MSELTDEMLAREPEPCPTCHGRCYVTEQDKPLLPMRLRNFKGEIECPVCGGEGEFE